MYRVILHGAQIALEDKLAFVRKQANGFVVRCSEEEAQGIVVGDSAIYHLYGKPSLDGAETVYIEEFSGKSRLVAIAAEGAALAAESGQEPRASAGLLYDGLPHWEAGREYVKNELFTHAGMVGYARQAHTSQAVYTPFSTGTESLYGVRPVPDDYGIYPYVYNMKSEVGMRVRSAKDGAVYAAIQPADPLLYDPADVPALFEKEETEE